MHSRTKTRTPKKPRTELTLDNVHVGRGTSVTVVAPLLSMARCAFPGCTSHYEVEALLRQSGVVDTTTVSGTDAGALSLQFVDHDAALDFVLRCNTFVADRVTAF